MDAVLKKGENNSFDILRAIMAFFVIIIHVPWFTEYTEPWIRMAVPTFFVMSGYFFFGKQKALNLSEPIARSLSLVIIVPLCIAVSLIIFKLKDKKLFRWLKYAY